VCRKGRNTSIKLREASWSASLELNFHSSILIEKYIVFSFPDP
jgi:hypothetical protein